jgi:hypothetical protein
MAVRRQLCPEDRSDVRHTIDDPALEVHVGVGADLDSGRPERRAYLVVGHRLPNRER